MKTLKDGLAGSWYPGTAREMRAMAAEWESRCGGEPAGGEPPNVLVLPHAGWAYSGETAWRAARLLRGGRVRRVAVLAPLHRSWAENALVAPSADAVRTPLGEIPVDGEAIDALSLAAPVVRDDRPHEGEHAGRSSIRCCSWRWERASRWCRCWSGTWDATRWTWRRGAWRG